MGKFLDSGTGVCTTRIAVNILTGVETIAMVFNVIRGKDNNAIKKKMKRLTHMFMLAIALAAVLTGCAVTDVDRDVDFGRYHSFAWGNSEIKVDNPEYRGGLIDKRIKTTVQQEFAKRGIYLDSKNPDLLVSYHTYTQKRQQSYGSAYGYGPYMYGPYFMPYGFGPFGFYGYGMMPWGYGYGRSYDYTQGTLIIDVTDKATNELVWRGTVKGNVESTSALSKQIGKGVKAILKKYPVRPDGTIKPGPTRTIS